MGALVDSLRCDFGPSFHRSEVLGASFGVLRMSCISGMEILGGASVFQM